MIFRTSPSMLDRLYSFCLPLLHPRGTGLSTWQGASGRVLTPAVPIACYLVLKIYYSIKMIMNPFC
jgi:hypothetical protein